MIIKDNRYIKLAIVWYLVIRARILELPVSDRIIVLILLFLVVYVDWTMVRDMAEVWRRRWFDREHSDWKHKSKK